jgi:precorrin-2 dehydrogenase / sirohydrochlorin ferrochelatase
MRYLPIELDVCGREALVIGVSPEVVSKIDRLVEAGARVTVIAEGDPGSEVEERAREGIVTLHRRAFVDADLAGKVIVFVAPFTTPAGEAEAVRLHAWAREDGRLLCTVDRPEACTFINAAIVEASGLTLTISTGGASPGLARRLREDLGAALADPRLAAFVERLRARREALPRGERAARMAEAVKDFSLSATLRFPGWFDHGEDP